MQHLLFQRLAALSIFCVILSLGFGASPAFARNAIQVRLTSAPQTFDWNRATSGSESAVIRNLMEGLFTFDSAYNPVPQLAKSFQWSADRKTLDLILRKEVVWNDGTPLKAQQFADSFERLLNPTLNSPNAAILFDLVGARDYFFGKTKNFSSVGVSVIHDDHLRLVLAEPRSNFLNALTHWSTFPVRKDKMEAFPRVTLGPYQLAKETSPLTLTKNPHYLGPSAAITKIIFKIIPDGTTAIAEYQKGNLDYLLQVEDELLDQKISAMPGIGFVDPIRVVALLHFARKTARDHGRNSNRSIDCAKPENSHRRE
jgi:oligopeptide transport system substrate-binding protein